jgi:hypothetical protein
LETLRQEAGQAFESTHRIAEINLSAGEPIEVGGLAGFSTSLPDRQVSERDKALEMSVRDSSVHPGGFGRIVNCPFGLVHIKVEQDPPTGPILKRADRAVEVAYLVLAHSASLSASVGGESVPRFEGLRNDDVVRFIAAYTVLIANHGPALDSCRRDDASHQAKLRLIDVGRLHSHRQRSDPDGEVAGHASLKRCKLDEIGIALRTEVDGVGVDGEL